MPNVDPAGAEKPARAGSFVAGPGGTAIGVVGLTGLAPVAIDFGIAFAVGDRQRTRRAVVEPLIGDQRGDARIVRAAVLVERILRRERDATILVVERLAGHEIDGGAERAFIGVRRGGLAHLQRAEQIGGEDVEVEAAAAVGRRAGIAGGGGGQRFEAVEADAREVAAEAADGDLASFAVVAIDGDAGQALQRFGEVGVGEVGDVLGVDGVHHHRRRFS